MSGEKRQLHPRAIEAIKRKVKSSVVHCQIEKGWPEYESFCEYVKLLGEEILKHKKSYLSVEDIFSIFYDFTCEAIKTDAEEQVKISGNLRDILGEEKSNKLVDHITDYIISVPRRFEIYLPMPNISNNILSSVELSKDLSIEVFGSDTDMSGSYYDRSWGILSSNLELNKVYLKQLLSGYCSYNLENYTNKRAMSNFKAILQQGVFSGLFKVATEKIDQGILTAYSHYKFPKVHLIIKDLNRVPTKILRIELPIGLSKWLDRVDLNWSNQVISKAIRNKTLELTIADYLREPAKLIESDFPEAKRIKSAIQWDFDSYIVEDQTLAFLQICIGLEAILGDQEKNEGSLTETLADRCAYLISNNIRNRKSIKKIFKELYSLRSKLVHGNITELDSTQQGYFHWGRSILEYAIAKEIGYLGLGETP